MNKILGTLCIAGLMFSLSLPGRARDAVSDENTGTDTVQTRTHTRDMEAHYGTQTVTGGASYSRDLLFLTDHVSSGLGTLISGDPAVDSRVKNGIGAWVDNSVTSLEWVLGTPEGLPAADNLLRELTNVGGRCLVESNVGPQIDRGTRSYGIAAWVTNESSPGSGTQVTVFNEGFANVHYYERNATVETCRPLAAPALSPHVLAALLLVLLAVGVRLLATRRSG